MEVMQIRLPEPLQAILLPLEIIALIIIAVLAWLLVRLYRRRRENTPSGRARTIIKAIKYQPTQAFIRLRFLSGGNRQAAETVINQLVVRLSREANVRPEIRQMAEGYRLMVTQPSVHLGPAEVALALEKLDELARSRNERAFPFLDDAVEIYNWMARALAINNLEDLRYVAETAPSELTNWPDHAANDALRAFAALAPLIWDYRRAFDKSYVYTSFELALTRADEQVAKMQQPERRAFEEVVILWRKLMQTDFSEARGRPVLDYRLLTSIAVRRERVSFVMELRNVGRNLARAVEVRLRPGPGYRVELNLPPINRMLDEIATADATRQLGALEPGERTEARFELRLEPDAAESNQLRVVAEISFAEPDGTTHQDLFSTVINLKAIFMEFREMPNPYLLGKPLDQGNPIFVGRKQIFEQIKSKLGPREVSNHLLITGQRRMGKTSVLYNLPGYLGADYTVVNMDCQYLGSDQGISNFCYAMALEIYNAVHRREHAEAQPLILDEPTEDEFNSAPLVRFERNFLPKVLAAIGDKQHLVLIYDEFDKLDEHIEAGRLDESVLPWLRHLMQTVPRTSFVFCGARALEEKAEGYWSVFFNSAGRQHISFMSKAETFELVLRPAEPFGIIYDDLARERIWEATGGYPYYVNMVCWALIEHRNRNRNNDISDTDVKRALDVTLETENTFDYIWNEATSDERVTLAALYEALDGSGRRAASADDLVQVLQRRNAYIERQVLAATLDNLARRELVERVAEQSEAYRFRFGLVRLWLERNKPLSRVIETDAPSSFITNDITPNSRRKNQQQSTGKIPIDKRTGF